MKITIFTDGSSRGNPGPGGWGAIIVTDTRVIELGGGEDATTNNRMELTAVIEALSNSLISAQDIIIINSDSRYVINGSTNWMYGWKTNGWITKTKEEVLNRDLWERMIEVVQGKNISWNYVGGHSGIVGNERCDIIATSFADKAIVDLYNGPIEKYTIKNILDTTQIVEKASKKSHSKAQAYSYVSMIDKKIQVHSTWAECEDRVKGKSGARYKKALSKADEQTIVEEFSRL